MLHHRRCWWVGFAPDVARQLHPLAPGRVHGKISVVEDHPELLHEQPDRPRLVFGGQSPHPVVDCIDGDLVRFGGGLEPVEDGGEPVPVPCDGESTEGTPGCEPVLGYDGERWSRQPAAAELDFRVESRRQHVRHRLLPLQRFPLRLERAGVLHGEVPAAAAVDNGVTLRPVAGCPGSHVQGRHEAWNLRRVVAACGQYRPVMRLCRGFVTSRETAQRPAATCEAAYSHDVASRHCLSFSTDVRTGWWPDPVPSDRGTASDA